jgi:hypothetical protein
VGRNVERRVWNKDVEENLKTRDSCGIAQGPKRFKEGVQNIQ